MAPTARKATDGTDDTGDTATDETVNDGNTPLHDEIAATANTVPPADAAPAALPEGSLPEPSAEEPSKPRSGSRNDKLATEVENGRWGVNRLEQIRRLTAAGYDANLIMAEVERRRTA